MCINESTPPQMNSLICDICKKPYSTKSNLNVHIKTIHHKILPFQCEFQGCNKSYSTLKRKTIHMRTHLDLKSYQCDICQKKFNENLDQQNSEGNSLFTKHTVEVTLKEGVQLADLSYLFKNCYL